MSDSSLWPGKIDIHVKETVMKRFIYTALLVFSALFSPVSGSQNEIPGLLDTIVCVKPGDTVRLIEYKNSIRELIENKEKAIWSDCCDKVEVDIKEVQRLEGDEKSFLKDGWPVVIVNKNGVYLTIEVTYARQLRCINIPEKKEDAQTDASLAMWYFFGKLLSETKMASVSALSDTAVLVTEHKINLTYRFGVSFPENIRFEIIGDSCFDEDNMTDLWVKDEYRLCHLKWFVPDGIVFKRCTDTNESVTLKGDLENYLYQVVCTATSCENTIASDTVFIGWLTPTPAMKDINCVPSSENSFVAKVKNADFRLSYHWIFEESSINREQQYSEGDSVIFSISPNMPGRLWLTSTGGCRASDTTPYDLHRSVIAGDIRLDGDINCIFGGDSLSLVLQNAPQERMIWRSGTVVDTLFGNAPFVCGTNRTDTGMLAVTVSSEYCPEDAAVDTFDIRKDLAVSIDPNETCISAHTGQTFKVIGNGIKPEVHWYGNGVEIDTSIYGRPDSIRLRLTNPGGDNVYVSVKAKECDRESRDTLLLRPKPEIPQLDTLWNALTPCIPLGKADTIELRVEPQAGVSFEWFFSENSKFKGIGKSDSNTILVRVDYALLDRETDIPVRVRAYTEGCPDSATIKDVLYATGAGIGKEWEVIQQLDEEDGAIWGYIIGFSEDGQVVKDYGSVDPFEGRYTFDWYAEEFCLENNTGCGYYFFTEEVDAAFNIFCRLTSKESQCYSIYTTVAGEAARNKLQRETPATSEAKPEARKAPESSQEGEREKEATACPGIVLHPNPVRSGKCVKAEGLSETESFTVECYTQQGRFLFRSAGQGATCTIPTGAYAPGVYIIRIQRSGKAMPIVKKLIVI